VNAAPAIVALQRQAEEIRQAELRRVQARLGTLSAEQVAAVEALTHGLVNKLLHPPMQALKQAAREGDSARMDALCEAWSMYAGAGHEAESPVVASPISSVAENTDGAVASEAGKESGQ
jgi:glutamyl-tRNA reductase